MVLYFRVTPYKAGSVTPANKAENPAAKAICFVLLFLLLNATAIEAAPCAKLEPNIAGRINTSGVAIEAAKKIGAKAQCIPVITINGMIAPRTAKVNQPATPCICSTNCDNPSPTITPRGPTRTKAMKPETSRTKVGCKKLFVTAGVTLLKTASIYFISQTIIRIGITDEP